jgi:hypothetical protein
MLDGRGSMHVSFPVGGIVDHGLEGVDARIFEENEEVPLGCIVFVRRSSDVSGVDQTPAQSFGDRSADRRVLQELSAAAACGTSAD